MNRAVKVNLNRDSNETVEAVFIGHSAERFIQVVEMNVEPRIRHDGLIETRVRNSEGVSLAFSSGHGVPF